MSDESYNCNSFIDCSFSQFSTVSEQRRTPEEKRVNILEEKGKEEEYFPVEKVLERRQDIEGVYWYFVSWESKEESWTEEENLPGGLKEEFERSQREMEGDKRAGGGGGSGRGKPKRRRLHKETGGDGEMQDFKCTRKGCGKAFGDASTLKVHLTTQCWKMSYARRGAHNATSLSRRWGEGINSFIQSLVNTPGAAPSPTIRINEEGEGGPPPGLPSAEGGNDMETTQPISLSGGTQGRDEVSAPPPPPPTPSSSTSSSTVGHFVEDGQTPSTSASILEAKQEVKVKVEKDAEEERDVKPGLNRKSLIAWFEEQDCKFRQMELQLGNETSFKKNVQNKLEEEQKRVLELQGQVEMLKEKLKDEENRRKDIEVRLTEVMEKRKKVEEELLAFQRRNQTMEEFFQRQREVNEIAAEIMKHVLGKKKE